MTPVGSICFVAEGAAEINSYLCNKTRQESSRVEKPARYVVTPSLLFHALPAAGLFSVLRLWLSTGIRGLCFKTGIV